MARRPVNYCVVDAFTERPFKGNPAAVCLLEEERDENWLQAVAREFNAPMTAYVTRITHSELLDSRNGTTIPRFRLRWFTPVAEVKLCGHGTLGAAHFLFTSGSVKADAIEFLTLSGILTAKRVPEAKSSKSSCLQNGEAQDSFFIELDLPVVPIVDFKCAVVSTISKSLNGASLMDVMKTTTEDVLIVVLPSGNMVAELQPHFDEMQQCPGVGMIITGLAPPGSGFDIFNRFFYPKLGVQEDPVCGSAHCALAPYWSKKLGKCDFVAYAASPRGGVVNVHFDETNQRVLLRGKAIPVMEGSILV